MQINGKIRINQKQGDSDHFGTAFDFPIALLANIQIY